MKEFAEYLNKFVKPKIPIEDLLYSWEKAKSKNLFRVFGNKLFYEKEITVNASISKLKKDLLNLEFKSNSHFYSNLDEIFYNDSFICKALKENLPIYKVRSYLLNRTTIIENSWKMPPTDFGFFKAYPGTKITHIYNKLAKHYSIEGWEEIRQIHAKVVSSKILKGILRISIHPLDYITISDNTNGWTSCMSMEDSGLYCGTLTEILNSPYVVVASLLHPINRTKIWRELYLVHPKTIINIKSYPFENVEITKIVLNWLKELSDTNTNNHYDNELVCINNYSSNYPTIFSREFYNDCGRADQYGYFNNINKIHTVDFNFSGTRICLSCGKRIQDIEPTRKFVCYDCEDRLQGNHNSNSQPKLMF